MSISNCLRCAGINLVRLPESSAEVELFVCPSCQRHYARDVGGALKYRWRHPATLALYSVIFDEDPVPEAERVADAFIRGRSPDELHRIIDEIQLELDQPTQRVREALENRATEDKCREYLRAFVARLRRACAEAP